MNPTPHILEEKMSEINKKALAERDSGYCGGCGIYQQEVRKALSQVHTQAFKAGEQAMVEKVRGEVNNLCDLGSLAAGTPQAMEHNAGWENCKHHVLSLLTFLSQDE